MPSTYRRIVRKPEVLARFGVGESSLWRWQRDPRMSFPRPVRIGVRAVGWYDDELDQWAEQRERAGASAPHESTPAEVA